MGRLINRTASSDLQFSHSDRSIILKTLILLSIILISIWLFGSWGYLAIGIVLFFKMPLSARFSLLAISALFPLGPGITIGRIDVLFFHMMVPLMLLSFALGHVPFGFSKLRRVAIYPTIGVLFLVFGLIISWARNPVFFSFLSGAGLGSQFGLSSYLNGFLCVLAFFISYATGRNAIVKPETIVRVLLMSALIVGALRMLDYLGFIEVPFFSGALKYLSYEENISEFTEQARRIGGLDLTAGIAIITSFTLWDMKKSRLIALFGFSFGMILLILGGGRAAFIGLAVALLFGLMRRGVKSVLRMAFPLGLAYIAMITITLGGERSLLESQQGRIFMYEQIFEQQTRRVEGYEVLLAAWRQNPVLGKGISPTIDDEISGIGDIGGHGAYFSLLGLFGLFGLMFVILGIAYPLYRGLRHLIFDKLGSNIDNTVILSRFLSLFLIYLAFIFGVGGNGYNAPNLFFTTGLLVALLERQERHKESKDEHIQRRVKRKPQKIGT